MHFASSRSYCDAPPSVLPEASLALHKVVNELSRAGTARR